MSAADFGLVELAEAIARGEITSEAAVQASLDRAEACAALNAVVALEPEDALAKARQCDRDRAAGVSLGPLHGVPLAHKDMFYRAGHSCECGSLIRRGFVPQTTSPLIARLDTAGAITIGRLHMAEFALGPTGHNAHLGRCRNPWNGEAISGGSSSGSGAAVAAGIVPAALGSDTGGSVRLPAAFCGIAALKPTHQLLPSLGMMPLSESLDTAGPLARSSLDLARLMSILTDAGRDFESMLAGPLNGVTIGIPTSYYVDGLDAEIAAALAEARRAFADCGARLIDVAVPQHEPFAEVAARIWAPEAASLHRQWLEERPHDYGEQVRNRLIYGLGVPAIDYIDARRQRQIAVEAMLEGPFAQCDLLLTPATRMTVPMAADVQSTSGASLDRMIGDLSALTRPVSMLGLPALVTPMGADTRGLPIGLQLIGRPHAEELLLRAGHWFERTARWNERRPSDLALGDNAWTSASSSPSETMAG